MSTVHISLVRVRSVSAQLQTLQVPLTTLCGTPDVITSAGTYEQSTLAATDAAVDQTRLSEFVWRIAVVGADDIYAVFGADPEPASIAAAAAAGYLCPAGGVYEFGVGMASEVVAVINAA